MKRSAVVFVNGSKMEEIVPVKKSDVTRALSSFSPGSKVLMVLKSYYREKQLSQLNVFYAYVGYVAKHTGHGKKEIEKSVLENYGLWTGVLDRKGELVFKDGHGQFKLKSLRDYNTSEISELVSRFHGAMFDDFGLIMPDPQQYAKYNLEIDIT